MQVKFGGISVNTMSKHSNYRIKKMENNDRVFFSAVNVSYRENYHPRRYVCTFL